MKDLNDLMQAILDMDAAQRKATEAAKAERAEQLGRLDAQRRAIADDLAAKAQARSQAAAAAAAAANRDERSALEARRQAAEAALEATAAAHKDEWAATLCRRALAGNEAGGEA